MILTTATPETRPDLSATSENNETPHHLDTGHDILLLVHNNAIEWDGMGQSIIMWWRAMDQRHTHWCKIISVIHFQTVMVRYPSRTAVKLNPMRGSRAVVVRCGQTAGEWTGQLGPCGSSVEACVSPPAGGKSSHCIPPQGMSPVSLYPDRNLICCIGRYCIKLAE
ncbi:hypothetical protein Btru_037207 [Bulinus truncatus]|nr:hypothetical protein Btru_037207 [Bulinus truncatus]